METRDQITQIFRDVLNEPDLDLPDELTAEEVDGWDSLTHINLLFSIESEMGVNFTDTEMGGFDNVGELISAVESKLD